MKRYCFFVIFVLIFLTTNSWAIDLPRISQAKIRLSVPTGQTKYGEVTVENPGSEERSMRLYLEDWYYLPGSDGSKEFMPADSSLRSCASWISFSPAEFTLPPFGKQRVSYSVKVPEGKSGGYYEALFFENTAGAIGAPQAGIGATMDLILRIAALFYVEVEGTVRRNAEFSNLVVEKESNRKPLTIKLDFKNIGNTDITTSSSYNIIDRKGMVYARGVFNDLYSFPGDSGKLIAVWKNDIPKGRYDLVMTFNLGKALEEANVGRGPVITKEAGIEIGENGDLVSVGELK